jgi:hypothetical protein
MSKREKLLQRLLSGITKGWSFAELRRAAEGVGIAVKPGRGDECKFCYPGKWPVIVDSGRSEVLPVYVKNVRNLVREILDEREQQENQSNQDREPDDEKGESEND